MAVKRIVVLDGYTLNPGDNPWDELSEHGQVVVHQQTIGDELLVRAKSAEILVVNKVPIRRETVEQLPNLEFIAVTATGYDCVDIVAARDHGIPVANVPVYGTDSVAQYVFSMLLHICHRVDLHDRAIREGEWQDCGNFSFWKLPLAELVGKRMGIIGFGRIGRRVGQLANAFGMQVCACSPHHVDTPSYDPFRWVDLETLATKSDVISLHCPLTDETRGLVDSDFLAKCKANMILLNASRGPLIVESDLANALNNQQIAAAGLDVVSEEPINPDNPLLTAKNCFLTPHYAWATLAARQRLMKTTVENVARFVQGEPQNIVNP